MGISRDSRHKRRHTGGKRPSYRKKRKFEMGRPAAMTKLVLGHGEKRVHVVRGRGGNLKFRALRLETGNFAWRSETVARKTRILDVVYNASNNELVRTKTLVKSAIVQIDAAPFRQYFEQHYGQEVGSKKKKAAAATAKSEAEPEKKSSHVLRKLAKRKGELESHLEEQFASGRLLASISSRPGQSGRADGYILEGKELEFYQKQLAKKKKGQK
ncbi:40s ribosomal protein s8 [Nannochloropsis gaditana]|uniref:40S ribosomal protein S8 n=2 Tax=Nannochloropsis gaditana TaxID=72520 RepID=W7TXP8_9STRA|nr:40s ribosomal protein s8 [Nannochloropsis gaditana]